GGNVGFGFNAAGISGFPTGAATLTGGGSYVPGTGFAKSAGGFRCTSDVGQGPLAGCLAGQGVRWDTAALLAGTTFKCTGAAAGPSGQVSRYVCGTDSAHPDGCEPSPLFPGWALAHPSTYYSMSAAYQASAADPEGPSHD